MINEKNVIRNQMKKTLAELSKPLYEDYSYQIAKSLYQDEDWKNAHTIGITISKSPEVDTFQIIRRAWEEGKQVVVPKCHPKEKKISFRTLTSFAQLESVYFGLLEPIEELTCDLKAENIELLIVPGLVFTKEGYRIGFGGGYYDRYLQSYSGKTISLCFHFQVVQHIPIEKHDLPVMKIITNNEVIKIK